MNRTEELITLIHEENREKAVLLALDLLEKEELDIVTLFENVLREALYRIDCKELDKECIWREHIKTSIVRTILEVSYPYILKESKQVKKKNKKVIIVCPSEEYHEIGARMAHSFFILKGYESIFIGANTPLEVILDSIEFIKPEYVAVSVTNFYNVIKAKKTIQSIKQKDPTIKILAGGQAFNQEKALESVDADFHLTTFDSIDQIT